MNKYGIENFKVECLEEVDDSAVLSEREIYWINELLTYGSNGYNASKGGDGTILYDYKEIIHLANLGYTSNQIERKVGCCKSTIYKVLKAHNCKLRKSNCKLIAQYDLAGNYILTFFSAQEAIRYLLEVGVCKAINAEQASSKITQCCKHKSVSAYKYKWEFLPEPS